MRWNDTTKYSQAKKTYMQNYNENEESNFLQYLDVNSLYALAMCQKLLFSSEKGHILEVDVEYPKKNTK